MNPANDDRRASHAPATPSPSTLEPLDLPRGFYRSGQALSAALIRLRNRFDGDFDQYLIYMIFVLTAFSRPPRTAQIPSDLDGLAAASGLNAHSLSDITEIPRETVRRKLKALATRGYLRRGALNLYHLDDPGALLDFVAELTPLLNRLGSLHEGGEKPQQIASTTR